MDTYVTLPLELSRKEKNKWEKTNYTCMAVVDSKSDSVKQCIRKLLESIVDAGELIYIVIWFFDYGYSQNYYIQSFRDMTLIRANRQYLIYRMHTVGAIDQILPCWGEFDDLDIIVPQNTAFYESLFRGEFYDSYRQYRKAYINRLVETKCIISDSGDGNEAQIVYSKAFEKVINTCWR